MSKKTLQKKPADRKAITRAEASRLWQIVNDKSISSDARHEILTTADAITSESSLNDTLHNKSLFVNSMLDAWPKLTGRYGNYIKSHLRAILDRTRQGESAETIVAEFKAERAVNREKDEGARKSKKPTARRSLMRARQRIETALLKARHAEEDINSPDFSAFDGDTFTVIQRELKAALKGLESIAKGGAS